MKFHIVRNKETLEDILFIYNLTKDELIEQNKHIRVWDKLIPGTKLKIPPIPDAVDLEVSDIEPFVEDYYPSLSEVMNEIDDNVILENQEGSPKEEVIKTNEPVSSKIYEEYENTKVDLKESTTKKVQDEEDDSPNYFSNMKQKPVFNNYYPYFFGIYNTPRYIPIPIIYYPVYYPRKPN